MKTGSSTKLRLFSFLFCSCRQILASIVTVTLKSNCLDLKKLKSLVHRFLGFSDSKQNQLGVWFTNSKFKGNNPIEYILIIIMELFP